MAFSSFPWSWELVWEATNILVWRIPRTEEAGWLQSMGSQRLDRIERPTPSSHFHFGSLPTRDFVLCPSVGIYLMLFSWLDWGYRFGGVGPRRVHTICVLITVDVDLDHLAVGGFIRCLHYKALPPSPLLPALCSWTEVAMCSTQLRSGGLCSTSLRVRYFHKLFGIGSCIFHERIKLWFSLKMAGWINTLFPMKMLWKWG